MLQGHRDVTKKEAEKFLKHKSPYNRNTAHVECKNRCDTSIHRGKWKHLKIIQKTLDQLTRKSRNYRKQL